jgi:hypothetical protein
MQYDESGSELPIIDQLIAAGESTDDGRLFFLQSQDLKVNLPFSAQDFNAALEQFDRDANGRTAIGTWLRRTGQQFSLVENALEAATTQFTSTLMLSSRMKRESGLELQEELISKRIELVTRALLSKESVERIAEIAALEHSPASSDLQRLGSDGRDLGVQEQSQTFALLSKVYAITARQPSLTKNRCPNAKDLVLRLRELKKNDLSY